MQGLEIALARLAGTVLGAVARSALAPRKGAGLVPSPVRPLPRPAGPDRLVKVLGGRLAERYGTLPEHERLAAVDGVRNAFAGAGAVDADRLFAVDLDPLRLARALRSPDAGLSGRTLDLYDELLGLCCAHLVEQLTAEASFPARAAVEQTRTAGRVRDAVEALAADRARPEAAALAFEERYARYVAATHGRLELFGLTLGRSAREWPLDTAYLTLAVSGGHEDGAVHGLARPGPAAVSTDAALAAADRLLLRGPAGSGKSTLVQWLALNAARRSFEGDLADLNRCVPFVLRLRAFTSADALPVPEDFLRAAGVPLSAPAGWTEGLLAGGRALVLVDGVDEVPVRLRRRTETWLKDLVTAFPEARYVVTTRPSAVPEEWLSRQGFVPHTLLPLDRSGIRAFLAHWHDAARLEDPEDEALDAYEASLRQAVGTRRDLGKLATNPLMCALLCALNRDRRMQLPRARKELYDAALDMLLVRRDTEREICGVEGVDLTREEQTALLQRLAYWLIRNGQVEADHAEAAEMVAEWLAAMPQVRGTPEQVFAHLMIRSGLLREPAPGSVGFVHRTFQDYLGAKAAVEARDFGVLVKNAHDDTWDDVVQMAVGHARVEERARLLKQLLRRADRAPRLRHRLILLAAACLEHAPELDPAVRAEVEESAQDLVPPRSVAQMESLAQVGELVLSLLPGPHELTTRETELVVRMCARIGGDPALHVLSRFRANTDHLVRNALGSAWSAFDAEEYADTVLTNPAAATWIVPVLTRSQLRQLPRLPHLSEISLQGDFGLPEEILCQSALTYLALTDNNGVNDLSPLRALSRLTTLTLQRCLALDKLDSLAGLPVRNVHLYGFPGKTVLAPLGLLPDLRHLTLDCMPLETSAGEWGFGADLEGIGFFGHAGGVCLAGIEDWLRLTWLSVNGSAQWRQLTGLRFRSPLQTLQILNVESLDLAEVLTHQKLTSILIGSCTDVRGLGALAELPGLTRIRFNRCGPVDTTPLDGLNHLTVEFAEWD
ncbi:NACHT domain-containing protein [Streptomyces cinereoruber]|uniref:NACHT domain-containing protein n=1 Tax=Streptomyces cinereoruber TaxID=67260 RepID=UPI003C2D3019